jgi:hypothetical protein
MQERMLSPRLIHYSSRQLFWECNTKTASESFPEGLTDTDSVGNPVRRLTRLVDDLTVAALGLGQPSSVNGQQVLNIQHSVGDLYSAW